MSAFVSGSFTGCAGTGSFPQRSGRWHVTSRQSLQAGHAGFAHFGDLHSLRRTLRSTSAARCIVDSENALTGNGPHHSHSRARSGASSPAQRRYRRRCPGAIILFQYSSCHSSADCATSRDFLQLPSASRSRDWQDHITSLNRFGFFARASAAFAFPSTSVSATAPRNV